MLRRIIKVPILGVIPWVEVNVDDEDSVSDRLRGSRFAPAGNSSSGGVGAGRGIGKGEVVGLEGASGERAAIQGLDIAIIHLKHIANFSDFSALETQPDAHIRYVRANQPLGKPDLVILPGTKNTLEDMAYLRASPLYDQIQEHARAGGPVLGICGGYQMLGRTILDPHGVESKLGRVDGFGLLDAVTTLTREKALYPVEAQLHEDGCAWLGGSDFHLRGYEMHMGKTRLGEGVAPFATLVKRRGRSASRPDGAFLSKRMVLGTYIHGLFDSLEFTRAFLDTLRSRRGWAPLPIEITSFRAFREREYDRLAEAVRAEVDMSVIYSIMGLPHGS